MNKSPFSYKTNSFGRSPSHINRLPSPFGSKSPCSHDRMIVSPRAKSPARSPMCEKINGTSEHSFLKTKCTPSTPKQRKQPLAEETVLDAPSSSFEVPSKLIDLNSEGHLAVSLSQAIYIWNSGEVLELVNNEYNFDAVCWVGDNNLAISSRGQIELWNVKEKKLITPFKNHKGRAAALSSFGDKIAIGGASGVVYIYHTNNLKKIDKVKPVIQHETETEVSCIAWSSDGSMLACGFLDGTVAIIGSDLNQQFNNNLGEVTALTWSPANVLYIGYASEELQAVGYIQTIKPRSDDRTFITKKTKQISALSYIEPYGLAVGYMSFEHSWELLTCDLIKYGEYNGHREPILNIATCKEKNLVVSIGRDETIRIWQLQSQTNLTPSPSCRRKSPFGSPFIR